MFLRFNDDQKSFAEFVVALINRFIVLIDSFWKLHQESKGLILANQMKSKLKLDLIGVTQFK